jgi:hypothetical protein
MSIHLRPGKMVPEAVSTVPVPVTFVPLRKTSAEEFVKAAHARVPHAWGGFVLLRWPDGFVATLQIAYLQPSESVSKPQWTPLTLASGSLGKVILKHIKRRSPLDKLVLLNIPFLRLLALVHFASGEVDSRGEPTVSIVQPGITRLSARRDISLSAAARLIAGETLRLSVHLPNRLPHEASQDM